MFSSNPLALGDYSPGLIAIDSTFTALLSQSGDASYNNDSQVNRVVDGQRIWFTVSQDLVDADLDNYRPMGSSALTRRGDLDIADAPTLTER